MTPYQISSEAQNDLFEIWRRIAHDSIELASRIEGEFYSLFESLAQTPGQGHIRKDLTKRPVLFFPPLFVSRRISSRLEADTNHGSFAWRTECKRILKERP